MMTGTLAAGAPTPNEGRPSWAAVPAAAFERRFRPSGVLVVVLVVLVTTFVCASSAQATLVRPMSFNEAVAASGLIFVGTVTKVDPHVFVDGPTTSVSFTIDETIYGSASDRTTLTFVLRGGRSPDGGGTSFGEMPEGFVGHRDVVFIRRGDYRIQPFTNWEIS